MTRHELEKLSLQDAYDVLVRCAGDGTFPSSDGTGGCWYRRTEEASCKQRCPAGVFIPDEEYSPELEGLLVTNKSILASILIIPPGMNVSDMRILQAFHDGNCTPWNVEGFIGHLNSRACFDTVKKVSGRTTLEDES